MFRPGHHIQKGENIVTNKSLLQLPSGSAGLFLKDAARHQAAIDTTYQLYKAWGYTMVHTPMVDFFDAHSHFFTEAEEDRLYRLVGRDGDILMLRSDITIFLLKHYQSLLKDAELPLRLAYSDSIIRHEDSIDISRNEHYQTGVEYIAGVEQGDEQELEILLLLCENLQALRLREPVVHIGSRKIFNCALSFLRDDESRNKARNAVLLRDWGSLDTYLSDVNGEQRETITHLFSSIWEAGEIPQTVSSSVTGLEASAEIQAEIDALCNKVTVIGRHFPDIPIRIDLSEIGARHYYSGLAFQVYLPDLPHAVASGGRYDQLLTEMGLSGSATGYSVILSSVPFEGEESAVIPSLSQDETSLEERYKQAKKIRSKGGSVCL